MKHESHIGEGPQQFLRPRQPAERHARHVISLAGSGHDDGMLRIPARQGAVMPNTVEGQLVVDLIRQQ